MQVLNFEQLESHGIFEFCYSVRYPKHWNEDSAFVDYDDFVLLCPYLEQVIPNYKYFGPQRVTQKEWKRIETLALEQNEYKDFFQEIDNWKEKDPENSDFFWIQGV